MKGQLYTAQGRYLHQERLWDCKTHFAKMDPKDILLLKKNAMALRNTANVVLALVEKLETADSAGPVTKKTVIRELDLHTRLLNKGAKSKPAQYPT